MKLRHALRSLFKTPSVTLIATLSLALGIGATAAIYSAGGASARPSCIGPTTAARSDAGLGYPPDRFLRKPSQ